MLPQRLVKGCAALVAASILVLLVPDLAVVAGLGALLVVVA